MTTANDLCHSTVAKHSFPYSFTSDKNLELNNEDITESDITMVDENVALEAAINFRVTRADLDNIDVDVAVAKAAEFLVTEGDLTRIDQCPTGEERAEIAMTVDLADRTTHRSL